MDIEEHPAWAVSGFPALLGVPVLLGVMAWQVMGTVDAVQNQQSLTLPITPAVTAFVIMLLLVVPMVMIAPARPGWCSSSPAPSARSAVPD